MRSDWSDRAHAHACACARVCMRTCTRACACARAHARARTPSLLTLHLPGAILGERISELRKDPVVAQESPELAAVEYKLKRFRAKTVAAATKAAATYMKNGHRLSKKRARVESDESDKSDESDE